MNQVYDHNFQSEVVSSVLYNYVALRHLSHSVARLQEVKPGIEFLSQESSHVIWTGRKTLLIFLINVKSWNFNMFLCIGLLYIRE